VAEFLWFFIIISSSYNESAQALIYSHHFLSFLPFSLSGFTSPSLIEVNPAFHNFHVDQFDVNDFQSNIGNVTTTWKFNAFNTLRPDSVELPKDYVKPKVFEAPKKVENNPQPVVHTRVISQLLQHFKQTAEVRQYLRYYGSQGSERFGK
jgi:hypothetical protein